MRRQGHRDYERNISAFLSSLGIVILVKSKFLAQLVNLVHTLQTKTLLLLCSSALTPATRLSMETVQCFIPLV